MRFKKKPTVVEIVEATHWDGTLSGVHAIHAAISGLNATSTINIAHTLRTRGLSSHPPSNTVSDWCIETPNGDCRVKTGDWIITFADGTNDVCRPDVFTDTYEPA